MMQHAWTYLMSNIPGILQVAPVYKLNRGESLFKFLMRSERTNIAWIKHIVQKCTKSGSMLMRACAGTFTISMADLFLPKQGRVIGGEVHQSCVNKPMP